MIGFSSTFAPRSDILEFSRNGRLYVVRMPDGYWPETDAPPDESAWERSVEGHRLEPLPFRAMNAYPFTYPDTPAHRAYQREWLTRDVE